MAFASFGCNMFLDEIGHEGETCADNQTCRGSLVCVQGICVSDPSPDGDQDPDLMEQEADKPDEREADPDTDPVIDGDDDPDLPVETDPDFTEDNADETVDFDSEEILADTEPEQEEEIIPPCANGDTKCVGDIVYVCNSEVWESGTNCTLNNQICEDGACKCKTHASFICSEGDAWWYDSCGNKEDLKEECGANACKYGRCADQYGIVWVPIPPGTFMMGCSPGDETCQESEKPRHSVTVESFSMTATEITHAQFMTMMESDPSSFTDCGDNCPVDGITYYLANQFCSNVNGRLPTEAEWEYAARAGTTTVYYCGGESSCLDDSAWHAGNSSNTPHEVATRTPNAFGLYDMLGNVMERVQDCWHTTYDNAPATGGEWEDGGDCSYRLVRGGSWTSTGIDLRTSARMKQPPTYADDHLGFRCVRD